MNPEIAKIQKQALKILEDNLKMAELVGKNWEFPGNPLPKPGKLRIAWRRIRRYFENLWDAICGREQEYW